ncbi:DciA family protein [Streptomyces californicus]|uniref:DciA family protein n=1 Tax=Streptomyces californicus TaxID=67351 RepID=UPI00371DB590
MATTKGSSASGPPGEADPAALALRRAREDARARGRARGRILRQAPKRRPANGAPVLFRQVLVELSMRTANWPSRGFTIAAVWNERFADIARHVSVTRVDRRTLFVTADSTAWATQLRLIAPMLLSRLNEALQPTGIGPLHALHVTGPSAEQEVRFHPEPANRPAPAQHAQEPVVSGFPLRMPLSPPDGVVAGAYTRQLHAVRREEAGPPRGGIPAPSAYVRALVRARTAKARPPALQAGP